MTANLKEAISQVLTPIYERKFSDHSYGFRPNRSAHQALMKGSEYVSEGRNIVVDMDLKTFFDVVNHDRVKEKWMLLYIRRWLIVPYETKDGKVVKRTCGVPQGSVIGPILANLFLHYCFDKCMQIYYPHIPFERYADDTVCHCRSQKEAEELREVLTARFSACKLQLHPVKTKIVYCKDNRRRFNYPNVSFDFLGHTFCPRKTMNRAQRKAFTRFLPDLSQKAKKRMKDTMRSWKLKSKSHTPLDLIAQMVNPVLRGWMNYYGKYGLYSMKRIMEDLNFMLARWAKAKYKRFKKKPVYLAYKWLGQIAVREPMFYHWKQGVYPKSGICIKI